MRDDDNARSGEQVVYLEVATLRVGEPVRACGLDRTHVDALIATGDSWPPILVKRADRRIIDGMHRLAAAKALGLSRIACVLFDGDTAAGYVEAVRRNVRQGLPLSLQEREQAATRILSHYPDWSDRRVAELCRLSAAPVRRLRLALRSRPVACPTARATQWDKRVGRDGRVRPADPSSTRERITAAIETHPGASLRAIAAVAGTSPETIRRARKKLQPVAAPDFRFHELVVEDRRASIGEWGSDAALSSVHRGDELVTWLDRTEVETEHLALAEAIPLGRVYVVGDEARRRASFWLAFADAVDRRSRAAVNA